MMIVFGTRLHHGDMELGDETGGPVRHWPLRTQLGKEKTPRNAMVWHETNRKRFYSARIIHI
ncbi:hypothetical protein [Azospirillum brasilense]|uniref:hypothetical protein n=1 Tax=Azospirillum brasilense TaxID=192 RepID=UPI0011C378DC|nr:hypothetical protein [Azospirillum brasilense]NUB27570.1 hypothetical protein [Azospirillum brasilense]